MSLLETALTVSKSSMVKYSLQVFLVKYGLQIFSGLSMVSRSSEVKYGLQVFFG